MSQFMSIALPGGVCSAFIARPARQSEPSAVLVLPEALGVDRGMREICEELAHLGYCAVCPDIFWRVSHGVENEEGASADRDLALDRAARFDLARGLDDVVEITALLRGGYGLNGSVALLGYGLGGLLACVSAASCHPDAAVAYYPTNLDLYVDGATRTNTPLLVHLGAEDDSIPPAAQAAITSALDRLPQAEVEVHPKVGHGFARRHSDLFERRVAAQAARYTTDFLQAFLG